MSLFVLSPVIEVEIGNWAKHKQTLNDIHYFTFKRITKKKIGHELVYFLLVLIQKKNSTNTFFSMIIEFQWSLLTENSEERWQLNH
jgi:hypothetical protein